MEFSTSQIRDRSHSAALVNIVHTPRKSFANDKESYMEFQQWVIWKNSLKFDLSSLDDILDISALASTDATTRQVSVSTHKPPKNEQQRLSVAIMSSKPGASSSRITQSSTDNDQVTRRKKGGKYCKFCRTNNEIAEVYSSHTLYEPKSGTLMCPVLRKLICPTCGATGDQAHTLSYCPVRKANAYGEQQSLFTKIKKSCRLASGKIRI